MDPLYNDPTDDHAYTLPPHDKNHIQPVNPSYGSPAASGDPAVSLIRSKISSLYNQEPDTTQEVEEAQEAGRHRTKHQQFIYQLSTSGKSLADIQTEWHNYYLNLPDDEKRQVWQEFYTAHRQTSHYGRAHMPLPMAPTRPLAEPLSQPRPLHRRISKAAHTKVQKLARGRSVKEVKDQLARRVAGRQKLKAKHHVQSLAFGLGVGSLVVLILLFSFFNERFIAPFITPSRTVSATPIIIDPNFTTVAQEPKIIIPKINVEVPAVYGVTSVNDADIQKALEEGVVHYGNTAVPGEKGNAVYVGHSSSNILNRGKYKFAFALLNRLSAGDTFILNKDRKAYVYKVYEKKVVKPTDVSVLGNNDKVASATLITCDPPGTNVNRMVIVGEQVSPDPTANATSAAPPTPTKATFVPGDSPTLWKRLTDWAIH